MVIILKEVYMYNESRITTVSNNDQQLLCDIVMFPPEMHKEVHDVNTLMFSTKWVQDAGLKKIDPRVRFYIIRGLVEKLKLIGLHYINASDYFYFVPMSNRGEAYLQIMNSYKLYDAIAATDPVDPISNYVKQQDVINIETEEQAKRFSALFKSDKAKVGSRIYGFSTIAKKDVEGNDYRPSLQFADVTESEHWASVTGYWYIVAKVEGGHYRIQTAIVKRKGFKAVETNGVDSLRSEKSRIVTADNPATKLYAQETKAYAKARKIVIKMMYSDRCEFTASYFDQDDYQNIETAEAVTIKKTKHIDLAELSEAAEATQIIENINQ